MGVGSWISDAWDMVPSVDSVTSWLPSWVTPSNVIGGLEAYGKIAGAPNAGDAQANAIELEKLKQQGQLDLVKLKASLDAGGGGGGGGAAAMAQLAYQKQRDRYEGLMGALQSRIQARTDAGTLTLSALRNLSDQAQRPLSR